jgi:hypothetical protein
VNSRSNQYYTASEAQAKLGLTKAKFHKMVRQGLIPKVVLPGMKQGVYPRRDINALFLSMSSDMNEFVFSRSSPADQLEEMKIGIKCFGRSFVPSLAERISFQQKSEFTLHSLKVHGRIVGYISMFHFSQTFLDNLLTGLLIEREITLKEVLPFVRLEPFGVYIDVIAVDPDLPAHLRRLYAGIMIFRFIDLLANLLANNYQITHLYTLTLTKDGERLVGKLGFQPMEGKSLVHSHIAYDYLLDQEGLQHLYTLQNAFRKRLQMSL